jgi:DNA mismatch endonuclease, patch repair protein
MARILRRAKIRGYRKHWNIIGKPDFAWTDQKIALFIDGCFWHGCPRCNRPSKTNVAFWRKKIGDNQKRDKKVSKELRTQGWRVLRIWECRVDSRLTLKRITRVLGAKDQSFDP